eukprot:NODE_246_length_11841_cov_1.234032.p3 type:complete len:513 gc:universal NODE_246_length_11841_cov_1.234032:10415-8877(-)
MTPINSISKINVSYAVSTIHQTQLITLIIKQHFGSKASRVCNFLAKKGGSTLSELKANFEEFKDIKKIMIRLLKHRCVHYSRTHPTIYRTNNEFIFRRLRFPLYAEILEDLYGKEAVKIFQIFCESGTYHGNGKVWDSLVLHHFVTELNDRYFDNEQFMIDAATSSLSLMATDKERNLAVQEYQPPLKKKKMESIFVLNFSRLDVELRNENILKSVTLNPRATLVLKAILDISASHLKGCKDSVGGICTPDHISKKVRPDESKIHDSIHTTAFTHEEKVVSYIDLLCFHGYLYKTHFGSPNEEPKNFSKVIQTASSEPSDQFLVPYKHLTLLLRQSVVESSIRSRLGDKALRVYRAMCRLKNGDEKMIANESMLPFSETRQLLYALSISPGMSTFAGNEGGVIGGGAIFDILPIFKSQERNPARGHYIYKLKTQSELDGAILDALYKFQYNILSRLLEEERRHRIIELRLGRGDSALKDADKKLVINYQRLRKRLWDSLLLNEHLVAIFRDF